MSPGYAFVKFANEADYRSAVPEMNGSMLYGKALKTSFANTRSGGSVPSHGNYNGPEAQSVFIHGMPVSYGDVDILRFDLFLIIANS